MPAAPCQDPMEVFDIRRRVVESLGFFDLVRCAQVSRQWRVHFQSHVWHTLDLKAYPTIKDMQSRPRQIHLNGHHIRVIKNIRKQSDLLIFLQSKAAAAAAAAASGTAAVAKDSSSFMSVRNLEQLSMRLKPEPGFLEKATELIRYNLGSLERLDLSGDDSRDERTQFALADALTPLGPQDSDGCSRLTKVSLNFMCMTRASFSILLLTCPALKELDIQYCTFLDDSGGDDMESFQHDGLEHLFASIEQVFKPIPGQNSSTPLLAHFPNLKSWETWTFDEPLEEPNAQVLASALQQYCPRIERLYTNNSSTGVICEFLNKVFKNLELVRFIYGNINSAMVFGLLLHKSTLKTIQAYDPTDVTDWSFNSLEVLPVTDGFSEDWMVHLLLSRCPHLVKLELPSHEMDIEHVDRFPWACTNSLKEIRVRIRGLDTKDLILAAITKWRKGVLERDSRRAQERRQQRLLEQQWLELNKYDDEELADENGYEEMEEEVKGEQLDREFQYGRLKDIPNGHHHTNAAIQMVNDSSNVYKDSAVATNAIAMTTTTSTATTTTTTTTTTTSATTAITTTKRNPIVMMNTTKDPLGLDYNDTEGREAYNPVNGIDDTHGHPASSSSVPSPLAAAAGAQVVAATPTAISAAAATSAAISTVATTTTEPILNLATSTTPAVAATDSVAVSPPAAAAVGTTFTAASSSLPSSSSSAAASETTSDTASEIAQEAAPSTTTTTTTTTGTAAASSASASASASATETQVEESNTIVDKVARQLLRCENLTTVWLGYKVWTI